MKKLLAILLILAMVVGMFAGCGAGSSNDDDDREEQSDRDDEDEDRDDEDEEDHDDEDDENRDEEKSDAVVYDGSAVTIRFAHTMGDKLQNSLNYYIGEFNKLYPNITVEHERYGAWSEILGRISSEIITDNAPNIAYCYPEHVATYNLSQSVVVLDDLIGNTQKIVTADGTEETFGLTQEQQGDFIEGFYMEGKVYGDGKMYTLPLSKSTEVLYYNKTFFEENGISVPTTWEEMEAVCQQLKELDPDCIPLGYDSADNLFINLCEQYGYAYTTAEGNGADHFLFNNSDCENMLQMLRQWYQAGYITTKSICGTNISNLFSQTDTGMEHCYMSIASSAGAAYHKPDDSAFEIGIAPIPQANPANPKVVLQGPALCILKDGDTTEQEIAASWLFAKYLSTNQAFQTEFSCVSGYMPVVQSVLQNENYLAWLDQADSYHNLNQQVIRIALDQAYAYYVPAAFYGAEIARQMVDLLVMQVMVDADADIGKLLQEAYDECVYMAG